MYVIVLLWRRCRGIVLKIIPRVIWMVNRILTRNSWTLTLRVILISHGVNTENNSNFWS